MKDHTEREVTLFTQALKVTLEDRAAFLDIECWGDDDLRHKVEALLKAHDRVGDFLEEPPGGISIE